MKNEKKNEKKRGEVAKGSVVVLVMEVSVTYEGDLLMNAFAE